METISQRVISEIGSGKQDVQSKAVSATSESIHEDKELTFDLGLVMAGAVSAGAYTAGVIDFLLEALEAWEKAKESEKDIPIAKRTVPFHKVRIKVLAGASAGGMTAAMMAATFRNKACGIDTDISLIKDIWVNQIDISNLLETKDLATDKNFLSSILDSTRITEIADDAFNFQPAQHAWQPLNYVHDQLKLYLTLSNLRGVPYEFNIAGESGFKYGMMKFTDYEEATINQDTTPEEWERIKDAAMATGAFPVGLSARLIHRDPSEYHKRCKEDETDFISMKFDEQRTYSFTCVDGGVFNNEPLEIARKALYNSATHQAKIEAGIRKTLVYTNATPPNKSGNQPKQSATNTENADIQSESLTRPSNDDRQIQQKPTIENGNGLLISELGNDYILGNSNGVDIDEAAYKRTLSQSLILIDPFPNIVEVKPENDQKSSLHLFKVIPRLIAALRRQALFKPEELLVASHRKFYSSFMISPMRYTNKGLKADFPIASGFLEGFGGFFLKKFREHDYQLGRRNCQRFLQKYFTLPASEFNDNPIFSGKNGELLSGYKNIQKYTEKGVQKERVFYPIIPLMNGKEAQEKLAQTDASQTQSKPAFQDMRQEEPQPQWPGYDRASFNIMLSKVNRRMKLIIDSLLSTNPWTRLVKHSKLIFFALAAVFTALNIIQWQIRTGNEPINIGMGILQVTEILITPFLVLFGGAALCYWYLRMKFLAKIRKTLRSQLVEYGFPD